MSSERSIDLLTDTDGKCPIPLAEAISEISRRSNVAGLGWDTKQIHTHFSKHLPNRVDWKPRMHELLCLAIEHAVRKANAV